MRARINPQHFRLCYVTNRKDWSVDRLLQVVRKAASGGVTMVQLREKEPFNYRETCQIARSLLKELKPRGIPLIINDRVDIAIEIGADGVHLGQSDMHPDSARKLLGNKAIIGYSLENMTQAIIARQLTSIDYVAIRLLVRQRKYSNRRK